MEDQLPKFVISNPQSEEPIVLRIYIPDDDDEDLDYLRYHSHPYPFPVE